MSCELWAGKLDAYVDGEGSREDLAAIEEHLRSCGGCARVALGQMQMKRATQLAAQRYAPSPEFRLRIQQSLRKDRKPIWSLAWRPGILAAVALLLLIAASALVFTRHVESEQALAEVVDLHVATLASANPVDVASTDRHTVKPWFAGHADVSPAVFDFTDQGYRLVGGRADYFDRQRAAVVVYQHGAHIINVFSWADERESLPRDTTRSGWHLAFWRTGNLNYCAVSDAGWEELAKLESLIKEAGADTRRPAPDAR